MSLWSASSAEYFLSSQPSSCEYQLLQLHGRCSVVIYSPMMWQQQAGIAPSGCWTCAPRTVICEVWGFLLLHSLWSPMLSVSVCRGWDPDFSQGWKCMSVCIWDRILHFYSQWSLLGKMLLHSITTQTKDLSNLYSSAWYLLKAVMMVSLKNKAYTGFWTDCVVFSFFFFLNNIAKSHSFTARLTHLHIFLFLIKLPGQVS